MKRQRHKIEEEQKKNKEQFNNLRRPTASYCDFQKEKKVIGGNYKKL